MAQGDRFVLDLEMQKCGQLATSGLRKLALDELRKQHGARVRIFDGTSATMRFEGENPLREVWEAYRILKPAGISAYYVFDKKTGARIGQGTFGLQDDIPKEFRPADA